ncbi:unnamed protein product [Vitrella brassicaformis CCMP3155]|uniref:CTP synthase n=1 Tax=Vitrella brassicaformis (strain CCMP3155) TaxID=1169540 RepID=A0A0G4FWT7_VITBC|nr:unnamed protein product [Vitrella brassicaformis CCMP3155]|mmetsp:Transcript_17254/g.41443  ORF Transcript_17254/g.41443 Transcript_17254/m.41443 type:complete len:604 (+) Transcript_17254:95-1906(+)|eukprot:CEM19696.1 unnamed protein product [Vitrella brassicaformis CCMP3155]
MPVLNGDPSFHRQEDGLNDDKRPVKYLVITGGTLSGLGKGTTISSLGVVLKSLGLRVTSIKIDPYLNIDAGTMSPYEHGEVYVLEDGGEVDLDLGNYERFLDITLTREHNITTGKIYQQVIEKERKGEYLGKTVQVVPHVTDAIQEWIERIAHLPVDRKKGPPDICLIEVGGTVGDIESSVYLEALQQFSFKVGLDNFCLCQVGFVPVMGVVGEQKTKPTQHSVRELRQAGLKPDFIFCRSEAPLGEAARHKIALFGQCPKDHVISVHDVSNIYHVPLMLEQQHVGPLICDRLHLHPRPLSPLAKNRHLMVPYNLANWAKMAQRVDAIEETVTIGVVGKYTGLSDSYLSVIKALNHAATEAGLKVDICWIESTDLEPQMQHECADKYDEAWRKIQAVEGVLCPGGFGDRGIEGKALSARFCRQNGKPYLGICLGLQTAVIEFAREVLQMDNANSEEFDKDTTQKVVVFMPEVSQTHMGGTMRLGTRPTIIKDPSSLAFKLYDHQHTIHERHRHRYEVNPAMVAALESKGFIFTGHDQDGQRMEIGEIPDHPYFVCTQFHPEFKSRPMSPSPVFLGLILAAKGRLTERLEQGGGKLLATAVNSD